MYTEENKPAYYSVLTAQVRYDKRLSPMEKILYSEISALLDMNGKCFASNSYFANLYGMSEQSISNCIKHLKETGYIKIIYERVGTRVSRRYIYLAPLASCTEFEKENSEQKKNIENKTQKKENKKAPLIEREPENEIEKIEKIYLENYKKLYDRGTVATEKPVVNWRASRVLLKKCLADYGAEVIAQAVRDSISNEFIISKGYALTTILSAGMLAQLINGNRGEKNGGFKTGAGLDEFTGTINF